MFLYRADYLKYDFIPMNKRIRRVYGQNLNDTVCVVDPVMRGLGVDLDAVARIQAVFAAVQIYGQDTLQNVDKFFTVVLIHLKLVFRACGGRRHQVEDTRKTGKSLCISIDQVLYDLGVDLGTVHGKTPADRGFLLIGGGVKEHRLTPRIVASFARESIAIEERPRSNWERKPMDRPDSSLSCFSVYFFAVRKAFTLAPMVTL